MFYFSALEKKITFQVNENNHTTCVKILMTFTNIFVVQVISLLMEESAIMNVYAHNCTCTCTPVCNSVGK